MDSIFVETMLLTFKLASITTLFLLIIGTPIAYLLATSKSKMKPFFEAVVSMPLVLPPTVLGFYLLMIFSPQSFIGRFLEESLDVRLIFTFEGLVIGSIIFSLPFLVQPIQSGFESIPKSLTEASFTLGKGKMETFFKVLLPNIKPSILTGAVLSFAHTIGEFGVVLMIGGNIEGKTKVASIAIYDEVEALNYELAHKYAATLFLISFLILLIIFIVNKKSKNDKS
ncbi:MAG TPA: molybdate ABC transporter permease subunit [Campylobacterales bacterium]|nr:molybdate ABC transporter permease subunit [Campylobacterales bacterium]